MASQDLLLQSLLAAADTAQQAYNVAQVQNPGDDLSQLYLSELRAQRLYLDALNKSFQDTPEADAVDAELRTITARIKANLADLESVNQWMVLVDDLVKAATNVAALFV